MLIDPLRSYQSSLPACRLQLAATGQINDEQQNGSKYHYKTKPDYPQPVIC